MYFFFVSLRDILSHKGNVHMNLAVNHWPIWSEPHDPLIPRNWRHKCLLLNMLLTASSYHFLFPICHTILPCLPSKCSVVPGSICFKKDGKQRFIADLLPFHLKIRSFYGIINSTVSSAWFLCKHILLMLAFELFPFFCAHFCCYSS